MAKRKASYVFPDEDLINLDDEIKFITTKLLEQEYKAYDDKGEQLDIQEQYKFFYNLVSGVLNEYIILNNNTILEHPNICFPELLKKCHVDIVTLNDIFEYEKEYFIFLNLIPMYNNTGNNDTNPIGNKRLCIST